MAAYQASSPLRSFATPWTCKIDLRSVPRQLPSKPHTSGRAASCKPLVKPCLAHEAGIGDFGTNMLHDAARRSTKRSLHTYSSTDSVWQKEDSHFHPSHRPRREQASCEMDVMRCDAMRCDATRHDHVDLWSLWTDAGLTINRARPANAVMSSKHFTIASCLPSGPSSSRPARSAPPEPILPHRQPLQPAQPSGAAPQFCRLVALSPSWEPAKGAPRRGSNTSRFGTYRLLSLAADGAILRLLDLMPENGWVRRAHHHAKEISSVT